MSNRTEALTEEFKLWLNRYTPRRALLANPEAMAAEIKALMRVLLKMAPVADYLTWLDAVTNQLDFQMKTSAWPTVAELGAACSNQNKAAALRGHAPNVVSLDPVKIAAKRMNSDDNVGDGWLYGRNAVALEASGLVSAETMRRYRSALYFAAKKVVGDEMAKRMEAGWIARHEAAVSLERSIKDEPKGEPFKRMPTNPNDDYANAVGV